MVSSTDLTTPNGFPEGHKYYGRYIPPSTPSTNSEDDTNHFLSSPSRPRGCVRPYTPRSLLWTSILNRLLQTFDKTVFLVMQSMYKHTECFITNIQESITTENGLIEGNAESCICFNIYLDTAVRIFLHNAKEAQVQFPNIDYQIPMQGSKRGIGKCRGTVMVPLIGWADDLSFILKD